MLNKKICVKCSKTRWPAFWKEYSGSLLNIAWDELDEKTWENEKEVICPHDSGEGEFDRASILRAPPKWCIYKFEHAIAEAKSVK